MGMDAIATIWVGFRKEDYDPEEEDLESLPAGLKAFLQDDWDSDGYEDDIPLSDDLTFELFHAGDELAGGGVEVFSHDWDYGAVAFDLASLAQKIAHVLPLVQAKFMEWKLKAPVGVWIQTNYF